MLRKRFHFAYVVIDLICLITAFYFHYLWRYNPEFLRHIFTPKYWGKIELLFLPEYTSIFVLWCSVSLFSLHRLNLFTTDRSLTIWDETFKVLKALLFAVIPTAAAIFMLKFEVYSRLVFVSSWISAFLLLSSWRIGKRFYIKYRLKKGLGLVKVLIVGLGPVAEAVLKEINNHVYLGLDVVGVLSQEKIIGDTNSGLKIMGTYNELEQVIKKYYVDEVFVVTHLSPPELEQFIMIGRKTRCGIRIVPEGFEYIYGELKTYNLGYLNFLEYGYKELHGTELFKKRFIDIIGSYLLLAVLSPVFIISVILIKLKDNGPVFYISKRVGRKGRHFDFYKFRSMVVGADKLKQGLINDNEVKGPVFKIKKDPRITNIGRFMRRYSIDELPQLWNVLKGDMSLVGPRPPMPDEVEKYDLWQMRRLEVKPGITCLWQVRGRSNLGFYKWVKWDLWYIDNWSLWLDLRILFWTIPAVVKGKGAY